MKFGIRFALILAEGRRPQDIVSISKLSRC